MLDDSIPLNETFPDLSNYQMCKQVLSLSGLVDSFLQGLEGNMELVIPQRQNVILILFFKRNGYQCRYYIERIA